MKQLQTRLRGRGAGSEPFISTNLSSLFGVGIEGELVRNRLILKRAWDTFGIADSSAASGRAK